MGRVQDAVRGYPSAAMYELYAGGDTSVFQITVACLISVRTFEEVTLPTARRLFAAARTPQAVAALTPAQIDQLIQACTFHERKAGQIHAIARRAVDEFGGELPCDEATLLALPGIGVKCAHLVLGIVCGQPRVSVDIHVHRITNRWGYVAAPTPEKTTQALEARLPRQYWVELNRVLVPFGKHICKGPRPLCSRCPVRAYCRQVGVSNPG